jgi:uncharacterized membrane protein YdjX (TVP38/TMEM64 family)
MPRALKSHPPTGHPKRASSQATRRRRHFNLSAAPWGKIAKIAAAVVVLGIAGYLWIDFAALHDLIARCNGPALFAALVFLPLVGFPVRLLHIAAGIRFGVGPGLALVSLSILLQLLASHAIIHRWGRRIERIRWVKKIRERIPPGAHASVSLVALLLPGAPYMAVNYALPLIGVPRWTFLLCAWPLHTLRSTVSVIFGDQSNQLTPLRLALLLGYAMLLFGASWWTYRRMREQFENPPPKAGGQT